MPLGQRSGSRHVPISFCYYLVFGSINGEFVGERTQWAVTFVNLQNLYRGTVRRIFFRPDPLVPLSGASRVSGLTRGVPPSHYLRSSRPVSVAHAYQENHPGSQTRGQGRMARPPAPSIRS